MQAGIGNEAHTYFREEVAVHIDAVTSWILLGEGRSDEALSYALAAAEREDAVDKHPVTPGEVIPARELYAEMLFETGKFEQSLEQFDAVLAGSPNRLNALLGAGRAASQAGDTALAGKYYEQVREQTQSGNRQRAGLEQAWAMTR